MTVSDSDGHTSWTPLTISVADVNDHDPEFSRDKYEYTVDEGEYGGDPKIVGQVGNVFTVQSFKFAILYRFWNG